MDVACRAAQCGLTTSGAWPAACCDPADTCANGGVPAETGACTCSCPDGWAGSVCDLHAPHARVGVRLSGMSRRAWLLGAADRFRSFLGQKLAVDPAAVEYDRAVPYYGGGRRAGELGMDLEVRVLAGTNREATRTMESVVQQVNGQVRFFILVGDGTLGIERWVRVELMLRIHISRPPVEV